MSLHNLQSSNSQAARTSLSAVGTGPDPPMISSRSRALACSAASSISSACSTPTVRRRLADSSKSSSGTWIFTSLSAIVFSLFGILQVAPAIDR
jgi:hypothetical protein